MNDQLPILRNIIDQAIKLECPGTIEHVTTRPRIISCDTKIEITFSIWVTDMKIAEFTPAQKILTKALTSVNP